MTQMDHETKVVERHEPFRLSPETRILMDELRKLEVGEIARWDDLRRRRGIDYQERGHLTITARRNLAGEGIHVDVVHGVGLKRLTEPEAVDFSEGQQTAITRKARRNVRWLMTINADDLDEANRGRLEHQRLFATAFVAVGKASKKKPALTNGSKTAPTLKHLLGEIADTAPDK